MLLHSFSPAITGAKLGASQAEMSDSGGSYWHTHLCIKFCLFKTKNKAATAQCFCVHLTEDSCLAHQWKKEVSTSCNFINVCLGKC